MCHLPPSLFFDIFCALKNVSGAWRDDSVNHHAWADLFLHILVNSLLNSLPAMFDRALSVEFRIHYWNCHSLRQGVAAITPAPDPSIPGVFVVWKQLPLLAILGIA